MTVIYKFSLYCRPSFVVVIVLYVFILSILFLYYICVAAV